MPRHGRAALLRLASWFDAADTETAHEIFTAAFGIYGARHLGGLGEETVAATTSWWDAPLAHIAAARLTSALPTACVRFHRDQKARLRDTAESSAHWRRLAAQEIRRVLNGPTEGDSRLHLSNSALDVLMELLTAALGSGDATRGPVAAGDLELDIRLYVRYAPSASIIVRGADGELTLEGLRLQATSFEAAEAAFSGEAETDSGAAQPGDGVRLVRHA
ncbi:MAG: DUF2397 family protein [Nocardiopsaceae bacterium]|nr:DUF2397 family protein [Nocardiopsaceae bacterium]